MEDSPGLYFWGGPGKLQPMSAIGRHHKCDWRHRVSLYLGVPCLPAWACTYKLPLPHGIKQTHPPPGVHPRPSNHHIYTQSRLPSKSRAPCGPADLVHAQDPARWANATMVPRWLQPIAPLYTHRHNPVHSTLAWTRTARGRQIALQAHRWLCATDGMACVVRALVTLRRGDGLNADLGSTTASWDPGSADVLSARWAQWALIVRTLLLRRARGPTGMTMGGRRRGAARAESRGVSERWGVGKSSTTSSSARGGVWAVLGGSGDSDTTAFGDVAGDMNQPPAVDDWPRSWGPCIHIDVVRGCCGVIVRGSRCLGADHGPSGQGRRASHTNRNRCNVVLGAGGADERRESALAE